VPAQGGGGWGLRTLTSLSQIAYTNCGVIIKGLITPTVGVLKQNLKYEGCGEQASSLDPGKGYLLEVLLIQVVLTVAVDLLLVHGTVLGGGVVFLVNHVAADAGVGASHSSGCSSGGPTSSYAIRQAVQHRSEHLIII